jgi:hypothetical protein
MKKSQREEIQARINGIQWVVYFVAAEKLRKVKIGVSKGIKRRMAIMQVDCPEPLSLYAFLELNGRSEAFAAEAAAHKVFNEYRYRGEWFHFTDQCKRLIKKQLEFFKKHKALMTEQEERANDLLERFMYPDAPEDGGSFVEEDPGDEEVVETEEDTQ